MQLYLLLFNRNVQRCINLRLSIRTDLFMIARFCGNFQSFSECLIFKEILSIDIPAKQTRKIDAARLYVYNFLL